MPDIFLHVPAGVFDAQARAKMARAVCAATDLIDRPADGRQGAAWVVVDEIDGDHFLGEGLDRGGETITISIHVFHLFGPADEVARADLAELFHDLCSEARPAGEPRPIAISMTVTDVTTGWWGHDRRPPRPTLDGASLTPRRISPPRPLPRLETEHP
ncbi:hypothetical protein [Caulobacter sp. NIBR1757]|uniref:hypothetical protein n=1 Tax=Caulobacter sp. NIBR1757 TaxID=3016000 RepID=UPI0022F01183|nr:hypothetical protein [Caulobacter sp. NIBR1757]